MTVISWRDVPSDVARHHHCLATIEASNEPKNWTDATTTKPDLVTWDTAEILRWVRDQLIAHRDEAVDKYGRRDNIDQALDTFADADEVEPLTAMRLPTMWEHLAATLEMGRWAMPTFHLGQARKLVLQILVYADPDAPAGAYSTCRYHQPPREGP